MVDEFLVVWPEMERIAKDYGLKLVFKKNFAQYYNDLCSEKPVSLHDEKGIFNEVPERQKDENGKFV